MIPILDGLDELPRSKARRAATAINQAFTGEDPFILTCRTADLSLTMNGGNSRISADAAVELSSVEGAAALTFITANTLGEYLASWTKVESDLRISEPHPMASILQRPLTIWLTRAACRENRVSPATFLDKERFPTSAAIESFLIEAMTPALLSRASRVTPGRRRLFRSLPSTARSREMLAFIAVTLTNQGLRRFEWWNLPRCLGPRERKSLATWLPIAPALLLSLLVLPPAVVLGFSVKSALITLVGALGLAAMGGLRGRWRASIGAPVVDSLSDFTWIPTAGFRLTPQPEPRTMEWEMRRSIRSERRLAFMRTYPRLAPLLVLAVVLSWIEFHVFLRNLPFFIVIIGTLSSCSIPPSTGNSDSGKTSWGPYIITRLWLAFHGDMPFGFTAFLEKLRFAGLLRSVGATYEFRNIELQPALASNPGPRIAWRAEPVSALVLSGAAQSIVERNLAPTANRIIVSETSATALGLRSLCNALADTAELYGSEADANQGLAGVRARVRRFNESAPASPEPVCLGKVF